MANKFFLASLGCPKNLVDSDALTEELINSGLSHLDNPENADILLINTCGFIEDAKKESIEEILKLAEIKKGQKKMQDARFNPPLSPLSKGGIKGGYRESCIVNHESKDNNKKLIVFGCLAKRYRDELLNEIPEIDAIFGVGEDDKIVEYCKNLPIISEGDSPDSTTPLCSVRKSGTVPSHSPIHPFTYSPIHPFTHSPIHPFTHSPIHPFSSYAYLKIAEGCSRKCTYCVIPSIRGEYKSIMPDEIMKKAEGYINAGVKELVLVAQDTASYGKDLNPPEAADIAALLKDLCSIKGDFWIRLLYAYPASIKEALLNVIAGEEKICKYLDMPFQHSEDRILKLMKRGGGRKEYLTLIKKIRRAVPDIALRTTFIAGFPSETEEEFNSLIKFIEEAEFDRLGAFKYSKEEGTPASRLKGHLTKTVKNSRFDTIMRCQADISLKKNKALIGRRFKAVIDEVSEGTAVGRLYSQAPEIDGVVIMEDTRYRMQDSGYNPPLSPLSKGGIKGGYHASFELKVNHSPIHRFTHSPVMVGDFVTVEITDVYDYDLKGIIVR